METHKFTVKESMILIMITVLSIATCLLVGISMVYGFLIAMLSTVIGLKKYGASVEVMTHTLKQGIWECRMIYVIIILMGATIATWIASGVVPLLIYYGFIYIEGMNFLFACFVILAILSYIMGTAIGTISTIGVALYGIGIAYGIPKEVIIGTLVSGAFIADKISPISGLMNLTLKTVGADYKTYLKEQIKTLSIGILLCLVFYYILGNQYTVGAFGPEVRAFNEGIVALFKLSPFLLVFPVLVVVLAIKGVSTTKTMSICVVLGSLVAVSYQEIPFATMLKWLWEGVSLDSGSLAVDRIIKGGGVQGMMEVILIVMSAVALSSLFNLGGVFEPLIERLIGNTKEAGKLMRRTAFLGILLTSITCDQTVGIIVPGKQLKASFKESGLTEAHLASVISDSGTIIAPIEFWNVNALILMAIFSINPVHYVPYAILCYGMPLIVIGRSYYMTYQNKKVGVKKYEQL